MGNDAQRRDERLAALEAAIRDEFGESPIGSWAPDVLDGGFQVSSHGKRYRISALHTVLVDEPPTLEEFKAILPEAIARLKETQAAEIVSDGVGPLRVE